MVIKNNFLKTLALIFLAVHLFTVHSKLIFHANPDNLSSGESFSFLNINEQMVISVISAIAYSIITVALITIFANNRKFMFIIFWFALMDGIGVWIYYFYPAKLSMFGAAYYAIYTFSIIVCFGYYKYDDSKKVTQRKIAELVGTSQSTISRKKLRK